MVNTMTLDSCPVRTGAILRNLDDRVEFRPDPSLPVLKYLPSDIYIRSQNNHLHLTLSLRIEIGGSFDNSINN